MTPAECKTAPVGAIKDDRVKGLELHTYASGRRVWYLYHRTRAGQRRRPSIGEFPTFGLDQAREVAKGLLQRVAAGEDVSAVWQEGRARMDGATVGALANAFLSAKGQTIRATTVAQYRMEFASWRGKMPTAVASTVTREDVAKWLRLYGDAPSAGSHALRLLRQVLNWAYDKGALPRKLEGSPATGHDTPPEEPKSRILTADEVRGLFALGQGDQRDAALLILLLGQRPGEVIGMLRSEIDLGRAEWVIPAERTKPGREQEVPLPPLARGIIAARMQAYGGSFVFPGRLGGTRARAALARQLRDWQGGAEPEWYTRGDGTAETVTPHDLRRTCSSYLALLGHGENIQAAILNHSPGRSVTLKHYSSADLMRLKRAALLEWEVAIRTILAGGDPFAASIEADREAEEKALAAFTVP